MEAGSEDGHEDAAIIGRSLRSDVPYGSESVRSEGGTEQVGQWTRPSGSVEPEAGQHLVEWGHHPRVEGTELAVEG
jgi:hypothetical protein